MVTDGRERKIFDSIIESPCLFLFVGVLEEKVVSICYLNIIPNLSGNASPYGIIKNVITLHNLGYGKLMIGHDLRHSWQHGCYKVMLQTGSQRDSTHQFYKSCGFIADEKYAFVA